MLRTLHLLLPALIPSWRFFDVIAPSPRIEFRLLHDAEAPADDWREFRPRPARLSFVQTLARLLWNPAWNENLFLVSCAERLLDEPTDHSRLEIHRRIAADVARATPDAPPFLQFRLILIAREGAALTRSVAYVAPPLART